MEENVMATLRSDSSTCASWMEHQILDHVKKALRVTIEWDAPVVSTRRKLSSVKFTLMSVVAESKPNMQYRIDRLAHDHDRFRRRVREIIPELESLTDWQQLEFDVMCEEIRSLLEEVDRHDEEEVNLLQDTLLSDEGGEG
jgi:hypothetical protein